MTYQHFFWDFDGTLFDTYPGIVAAFQQALREFGQEAAAGEIYDCMMTTISYAVQHYTQRFQLGPEFGRRFKTLQPSFERSQARPYPGARAICAKIVSAGGKNYLYTHRDTGAILYLKRYGMDQYFTDYVTSEDGFSAKPAPDAIRFLLDKHCINPAEAVMLGDRSIDILAGKNAGIDGGYFDPMGTGRVKEADFAVRSMEELGQYLKTESPRS